MKVQRHGVVFVLIGVLAGFPLVARALRGTSSGSEKDSQTQGLGTPRVYQIDRDVYAITDLYHSAGRGYSHSLSAAARIVHGTRRTRAASTGQREPLQPSCAQPRSFCDQAHTA